MKILHFSGDVKGGAARAALRLHKALLSHGNNDSRMLVKSKLTDDWRVEECRPRRLSQLFRAFNLLIDTLPLRFGKYDSRIPRSSGWASEIKASQIASYKVDIVHLHWVCSGFLSVEEIGKIRGPLIWTLHDMWAFSGAEHLSDDGPYARWRNGYEKLKTKAIGRLLDVDRWVWNRKKKNWVHPIHIVTPSNWLADCVRGSSLMKGWNVSVIPNVLNTEIYRPLGKSLAREILGLPKDKKLILFGAIGGTKLPYKGWDLLLPALNEITKYIPNAEAVVIGQEEPQFFEPINIPIHWMGHITDDTNLALIYSASDVTVIPSRQEAFGQVGTEAQSCGCPVVAFNATGTMDIVEHRATGYLAEPYSSEDLMHGIVWVLEDEVRAETLSAKARIRAEEHWSPSVVIPKYLNLYKDLISKADY